MFLTSSGGQPDPCNVLIHNFSSCFFRKCTGTPHFISKHQLAGVRPAVWLEVETLTHTAPKLSSACSLDCEAKSALVTA
jgi:hypothetical protein